MPAWSALAGLLASCALALVVPATAAAAEEVVERPADGVFTVEGHGWGHGRGMSQWGAQGAASMGVDAETILSAYYPGTTRAVLPPAPIRVLLSTDEGRDTDVLSAPGLQLTDVATGRTVPLPAGPSRWRVVPDPGGLRVEQQVAGSWTPFEPGGVPVLAGPVRFGGPETVRVVFRSGASRDYRGVVQAVRTSATALQTVVVLPLEDYLLGVVPRESSASWRPAALQAQAVAARSYSANKRARVAGRGTFDICDTTACQVFGGSALYSAGGTRTALEPATTTAAVRATEGVVRTSGGTPIFAEFSSSNGGWSTRGDFPYLRPAPDPWDGALPNGVHAWRAVLRASDLERRFPAVGTLRRVRITERDGNGAWGGRVRRVVLEGVSAAGTPTAVTTTGAGVQGARPWPATSDGLKSSWWRLTGAPAAPAAGSTLVAAAGAPVLVRPPGAPTGALTATFRNTGALAWPTGSLDLALTAGASGPDPLTLRAGRVSVRHVERPGALRVEPGETAVVTRRVDATTVPAGTHARTYRLRLGAGPVFGASVTWRVPVQHARLTAAVAAPPLAARPPLPGAVPAVFADGRTVVVPRRGSTEVRLQLRATGNLAWPVGNASPVLLGTSEVRDRLSSAAGPGWVSPTRAARLQSAADGTARVAPGRTGALSLVLHGNGWPVGVTREVFEPLWAGHGWLTGAARAFDVVRVDPSVPRLAALHAKPSAVTVRAGTGRATVVVRLRNLGGAAWPVGREALTTVGTGRFALATGWLSPTRPPVLAANAVRRGGATVQPGEVGEWRVPVSAVRARPGSYVLAVSPLTAAGRYGPVVRTTVTVTR
jgi:SpoIID/LytB domain protein